MLLVFMLFRGRLALVDQNFEAARGTLRYTKSFFTEMTRSVKYQKVLGFGGSGIATLWTELDDRGQPVGDFAVKSPSLLRDPEFRAEIGWMRVSSVAQAIELMGKIDKKG